jgi:glycerol uptake facilitator-like aquaporin
VTPNLAADFTRLHGMLLEGTLTFVIVFVFFATSVGRSGETHGGWAAGFATVAAAVFALSFTGAAFNPARTFGPALVTRHWTNHGVYWVGPLLGGVLAAVLYERIYLDEKL